MKYNLTVFVTSLILTYSMVFITSTANICNFTKQNNGSKQVIQKQYVYILVMPVRKTRTAIYSYIFFYITPHRFIYNSNYRIVMLKPKYTNSIDSRQRWNLFKKEIEQTQSTMISICLWIYTYTTCFRFLHRR